MNTFTYSYTGTLQNGRVSFLFPNAFAAKIDTGDLDDIFLGTGKIVSIRGRSKVMAVTAGPVVVNVYDYFNNTTQLPIYGGSGTKKMGLVNLGTTPVELRSFTNPITGAVVKADIVLNDIALASTPADLVPSLLRAEGQLNTIVSATAAESELHDLGIMGEDFLCGMWLAVVNNSGANIVGSATDPAFTVSIDYEPFASGWERKRRQTLPSAAAAGY